MVFAGGPIYRGLVISGDREDGSKMNFAMKPTNRITIWAGAPGLTNLRLADVLWAKLQWHVRVEMEVDGGGVCGSILDRFAHLNMAC